MSNKKQLAMVLLIMGSANAMDNTGNNLQNTTKNMKNTAKFIAQSPNPQGSKTGSVDQTLRSQQTVSLQPNDLLYNPAHPANERRPVLAQKIMSQDEINKRDVEKQGVEKKLQEKMMSAISEELEDARQEVQNQKAQNQKYLEKHRNLRSRIAKLDPNENREDFLKAFEAIQKEAQEQEAKREKKKDEINAFRNNLWAVREGHFAGVKVTPAAKEQFANLKEDFDEQYPQSENDFDTDSDGVGEFDKKIQALKDWLVVMDEKFVIPEDPQALQDQAKALHTAMLFECDMRRSLTRDQVRDQADRYGKRIKNIRESDVYEGLQSNDETGTTDRYLKAVEKSLLVDQTYALYKDVFSQPRTKSLTKDEAAGYRNEIDNIRELDYYKKLKKDTDTGMIDYPLETVEQGVLFYQARTLYEEVSRIKIESLSPEQVARYRNDIDNIRELDYYKKLKKDTDTGMIDNHLHLALKRLNQMEEGDK